MNTIINVSVKDRVASAEKSALYICGNSDYVIKFDFDDEWAFHNTKTARFRYRDVYQDQVFSGTECPVPVLYDIYGFTVGVFAGNLRTTTEAHVSAKKGALCKGGIPDSPTDDVYAQIMEKMNDTTGVSKEQIEIALKSYFEENPIDSSVSEEELIKAVEDALNRAKERGDFKGDPGDNGFSPTIAVVTTSDGKRLLITDVKGTRSVEIKDGKPGSNAISPTIITAQVNGGHQIIINDVNGTKSFTVKNGTTGPTGPSPRVTAYTADNKHNIAFRDPNTGYTMAQVTINDGKDYVLTDSDKREIANMIEAPESSSVENVEKSVKDKTVSILSFDTMETKSVKSHIESVQNGRGNPYAAGKGKNMLPQFTPPGNVAEYVFAGVTLTPLEDGGLWLHGTCTDAIGSPSVYRIPVDVDILAGTYCLSAGNSVATGSTMKLRLLDANGDILGNADMSLDVENAWMRLDYGSQRHVAYYAVRMQGGESYDVIIHPQFEAGEAATSFSRYENIRAIGGYDSVRLYHNGIAYTQDFGETVYGGAFDWINGKLTVTHNIIESYAGETLGETWISDRDVYSPYTHPTTGAQVVYKLVEPRVVQLDNYELSIDNGENLFYSDTGDTEVVYTVSIPDVIDDETVREDRVWSSHKIESRIKSIENTITGNVVIEGCYAAVNCKAGEEIIVDGVGEVVLHHCGKNLISGIGSYGSSWTNNGVTYHTLTDGVIRMNGTPKESGGVSGSYYRIMRAYLPSGRYVFSSSKALSPSSRYPQASYTINGVTYDVTLDGKTEAIFHLIEGTVVEIGLYNRAGDYTINDECIALQLEIAETQTYASERETYNGSFDVVTLPVTLIAHDGLNVIYAENAQVNVSMANTIDRKINAASFDDEDPLAAYGLPILDLNGDNTTMSKDNAVELDYAYRGRTGKSSLKWQGSSSLAHPKKNFTIKFDEEFEAIEPDHRFVDTLNRKWGAQKKYCLKANYIDATHARNIVSARIWGEMAKSRANIDEKLLARVNAGAIDGFPILVRMNGKFIGLYTMNIPKDGWMMGMGEGDREAIVCAETTDSAGTTFTGTGTLATDFEIEYSSDENDTAWITESLSTMINACVNSDGSDLDSTVAQYLDIYSAIDYYIFAVMLRGTDILSRNYLLATYDGVKWFFTPYDLDSTFGLTWTGRDFETSGNSLTTFKGYAGVTHADKANRVMQLIWTYKRDALIARYKELRNTVLSEASVQNMFLDFAARIPRGAYDADHAIWPNIPASSVATIDQIAIQYGISCKIADDELGVNGGIAIDPDNANPPTVSGEHVKAVEVREILRDLEYPNGGRELTFDAMTAEGDEYSHTVKIKDPPTVDETLKNSGQAADAKAVGDALNQLNEEIASKGNPTDDQVKAAVNDYLSENPMQYEYVTPEMYGAKGDGIADDTTAVESAVARGGLVIFPGTGYKIGGRAIKIPSNTYILGFGAKIIPYNWRGVFTNENSGADEILTTDGKVFGANNNIRINGLVFDGTLMKDLGRETPYGLALSGVKDCVVENCKFISNKDGIYIGTYQNPRDTGVVIRDCVFDDFWRQGVTIIHGTANIERCEFTRDEEKGINGIDAEPNYADEIPKVTVRNCRLHNCSIYANRKDNETNYGHEDLELTVENCEITSGVVVSCIDASFMRFVHVKNCILNDITERTNHDYAASLMLYRVAHAAVENCRITGTCTNAISAGGAVTSVGNYPMNVRTYINDCYIEAVNSGITVIGGRCGISNTYVEAKGAHAMWIRDYIDEAVVTGCTIDGAVAIGKGTVNDVYPKNVRFTFNTIKNSVASENEHGLSIYADDSTFVYNRVHGFPGDIDSETYAGTGNIIEHNMTDVIEG